MGQLATALLSAIAGLLGVFIGGWIANRNEKTRREADFLIRQLAEFYGPMLSLHNEIKARGEVRARVGAAAEAEWKRICARLEGAAPEIAREQTEKRFEKFERIIKYDNDQLRVVLIPSYKQMLALFREKIWLTDATTRGYMGELIEFIDIWERFLGDNIPGEVIKALGHTEEKLLPLYSHIEQKVDELQKKL